MKIKNITLLTLAFAFAFILSSCSSDITLSTFKQEANKVTNDTSTPLIKTNTMFNNNYSKNVVLAVNYGGDAYLSSSGIPFKSEKNVGDLTIGTVKTILGSQDSKLYQTYLEGDFKLDQPMENGVYNITFLFAEPEDIAVGTRVFDVVVNGKTELTNIDIRGLRDGKAFSALDKTINQIKVTNNNLNIQLKRIKGSPVISGLIVRKQADWDPLWTMVWNDEFDYEGKPDPQKWSHDEWPARKVNDEDQVYTAREKNVRVEGGKLIIEAHKESFQNGEYTSGRLHTLGKVDLHYGKINVRAKLPAGRGTWSAIWMLPSDPYRYSTTCQPDEDWQGSHTCDAWPNSGEIDIMEHVGFDMHNVHGTVHNKAYYWINWEQRKGAINARNVDTEFHDYSVEWSPEHITVLMDNTPYFTYKNEQDGWRSWPFDHPYHLILNLAIGGMWGRAGGPIDDSIFPVQMEIDYVRFYTRD